MEIAKNQPKSPIESQNPPVDMFTTVKVSASKQHLNSLDLSIKVHGSQQIHSTKILPTNRQRIEPIAKSQEQHSLLLNKLAIGVRYFDKKGTILFANTKAARQSMGQFEYHIGKTIFDIFDDGTAFMILNRIDDIWNSTLIKIYEDQVDILRETKWLLSKYKAIFGSHGKTVGVQVLHYEYATCQVSV